MRAVARRRRVSRAFGARGHPGRGCRAMAGRAVARAHALADGAPRAAAAGGQDHDAVVRQSVGVAREGYVARVHRRRAGAVVRRDPGQQSADGVSRADLPVRRRDLPDSLHRARRRGDAAARASAAARAARRRCDARERRAAGGGRAEIGRFASGTRRGVTAPSRRRVMRVEDRAQRRRIGGELGPQRRVDLREAERRRGARREPEARLARGAPERVELHRRQRVLRVRERDERIHRLIVDAHLEMQMRARRRARRADRADPLALRDRHPDLELRRERRQMRVVGRRAVRMVDDDILAVAARIVADERHDARRRRVHARAGGRGEIDARMHLQDVRQRMHALAEVRADARADDGHRERRRVERRAVERVVRAARRARRLEPDRAEPAARDAQLERGHARLARRGVERDPVAVASLRVRMRAHALGDQVADLDAHFGRDVEPVQRVGERVVDRPGAHAAIDEREHRIGERERAAVVAEQCVAVLGERREKSRRRRGGACGRRPRRAVLRDVRGRVAERRALGVRAERAQRRGGRVLLGEHALELARDEALRARKRRVGEHALRGARGIRARRVGRLRHGRQRGETAGDQRAERARRGQPARERTRGAAAGRRFGGRRRLGAAGGRNGNGVRDWLGQGCPHP
ncbi:amino acid ABC transporter membrane protein 2, PAAT family [Burkholderia pseudomallei MSHR2990]|nr:amino acid ABC transporter membrane protein 2, PAAT family [Burkholderia pseudomallei MSHR2990]